MQLEVQVYEGEGVRYRRPHAGRPLKWKHGRISFRVDDFPVHFSYRIWDKVQGSKVTGQEIQFISTGCLFWVHSHTYKGEPRPVVEGYTGDDGKNYCAITWNLSRQILIDIFMHEQGTYIRERVAHRKKYGRKRI